MPPGRHQVMNDDEFWAFCARDRKRRVERRASGEIFFTANPGLETSYRSAVLGAQLDAWSKMDGRGYAFAAYAGYFLPDGAALAPYASWVLKSRVERLTRKQKRQFAPLCPDFVVELTSPADPVETMQAKMREWMENGASLSWLIDADNRTVYVYRPGQDPEELAGVDHVDGEGPVAGFRLELTDIWEGL